MSFAIPRNNPSEYLLYLWKIIDVPSLSEKELLYKMSFELFLDSPSKVKDFVQNCVKSDLLKKNSEGNFTLTPSLQKKLESWQKARKEQIIANLVSEKKVLIQKVKLEKEKGSTFNVLLNGFSDRTMINRAVTISNEDVEVVEFNAQSGFLKVKIKGHLQEPYIVEISSVEKTLKHDCDDFQKRGSKTKKFCKHLVKLFLFLKERDEASAISLLDKISENIVDWEFIG